MTGREAFKIWAPAGEPWVDWVRPVPFVAMRGAGAPGGAGLVIPPIAYAADAPADTALVVDLPGAEGVREGLALARLGFRPVPLYNGTSPQPGAMALVETAAIENALRQGAAELEKTDIPHDAPPAFLLDSNRTHRYRMDPAIFDNSWDIYDQDMPSADCLLAGGIRRLVVRGTAIQRDLARILYKYQKKGLAILFTKGYEPPETRLLRKPRRKSE